MGWLWCWGEESLKDGMQGFSIANNRLWGVRQEEGGRGGRQDLVFFFSLFFYFYVKFLGYR